MTTYAAGLRVSAVVHLQVTAIEADRGLIRVHQGKGRQDRYTLLSARLLAELRAYWTLERCKPWLFRPGPQQTPADRQCAAHLLPGQIRRHASARHRPPHATALLCHHLLAAGVDPRTIQLLLGHRSLDTTTRSLRVARTHLANIQSPFALLRGDSLPPLAED